ncbi:secretion system protein [Methanocella sp. CWC-04]|uniref:Secretion system protein n=1 Tax=Methanooceanicella nereidis TaxID=2052831 RepID=A0AAP2RER3_9EURY|nr:type II/IV secretion system ATPase subunit [Methanocella sp. CWC-04]MCD1295446.1 secretion system protein [Methanocella sp. CWC-04]
MLHISPAVTYERIARTYERLLGIDRQNKRCESYCPVRFNAGYRGMDATIDCSLCKNRSTFDDNNCRRGMIKSLSGRGGVDRLLLKRNLVREYSGDSLDTILSIVSFKDDLDLHLSTMSKYGCGKCDASRHHNIMDILETSCDDPIKFQGLIRSLIRDIDPIQGSGHCSHCVERYNAFIRELIKISGIVGRDRSFPREKPVPYVMPRFSNTKILMEPPAESVFIRSYDVEGDNLAHPLHVSIYELPGSLEKLYFVVPWEYAMDENDLALIVGARDRLLKHRPDTIDFLDSSNVRPFFTRHAKTSLAKEAMARNIKMDVSRLESLTAVLVKYTSGLGILEDILNDPHIQDAYVNAPVGLNPLHVVVDGEECASNVFLSESDVESMISRLRAISGRPFSEANPVLDMDLGDFHTRVSVIGSPLTRGLAYAFRRHKKTPWTLPQLISLKMLSPYTAGLLSFLVDGQSSMLVTGSRGAGKTSLLSSLMLEIPQCYRILVIEDTPELPVEDMQRHGWKAQSINTRAAVSGSEAEFQASDALRAALRLGESALILGEVRGLEAKSLYEAMRVGASGNSVMGTIHGASCRDVYERVVHDIGVPPASFKSTDVVVICSTVRPGGSMSRERRVLQVAEVIKGQSNDDPESVFNDLMTYDPSSDELMSSDRIDTGRSESIQKIAKKWGISLEEAGKEILYRGRMKSHIAEAGSMLPQVMEAHNYSRCLNMFRVSCDRNRDADGNIDHFKAEEEWKKWFSRTFFNGA